MEAKKTLYLWDMANTLFHEKWNKELTGFESFEAYAKAEGIDPQLNPRQFEEAYQGPYSKGEMYNLRLVDGYRETLTWTKNNEAFTTGNREQLDWRAEYLNPKVGFDIRSLIHEVNSTFDYAETNVKTEEIIIALLLKKLQQGYFTVVYTDDRISNCQLFKEAAEKADGLSFRIYNILNNNSGIRQKDWYWQVGRLIDLLNNEKRIKKLS